MSTITWAWHTGLTRTPRWWECWKVPFWLLAKAYFLARCMSGCGPSRLCGLPYIVPVVRDNQPVWHLRHDERRWYGLKTISLATCDSLERAFALAQHIRDHPVVFTERASNGKLRMIVPLQFIVTMQTSEGEEP